MDSERIFVIAGAVAAVALQLFAAPYLSIAAAVPNFLVAYAMAIAIARAGLSGCLLPFLLGLMFDFVGGGPVGAMALVLMIASVAAARGFQAVDNDSLFMALVPLAIGVLVVELAYTALLLAFGYQGSLADMLIYRALPCFLYDFAIGCAVYLVVKRKARPASASRIELTQLR